MQETGSMPDPGRSLTPPCNEAREPQLLKPALPKACASQQEKPPPSARALQRGVAPATPQLERARATTKTQCGKIN